MRYSIAQMDFIEEDNVVEPLSETGEVRVTDPKTGGQKGSKPERFDLIPVEPLRNLARVFAVGAKKYADHNYRKGYQWSLSYAALMRHATAFWNGEDNDPETGLPHLAHACWHTMALMCFMQEHPDGDDRYKGKPQTKEMF